ncbi:hypothetical protein ACWDUX_30020 [Streptomyces sp. NPDC003444]
MSACTGHCPDCPHDFCEPAKAKPSRAAQRREWRQSALFELEELGDLYGIDMSAVTLR